MFLDLFYGLRDEGVNVAVQEWQMFMTALERGLHLRRGRDLDLAQHPVVHRALEAQAARLAGGGIGGLDSLDDGHVRDLSSPPAVERSGAPHGCAPGWAIDWMLDAAHPGVGGAGSLARLGGREGKRPPGGPAFAARALWTARSTRRAVPIANPVP